MNQLASRSDNTDAGVKYFSGTAVYSKSFEVKNLPKAARVFLDLGKVGDMAEVTLNGKIIDTLWKAPYRAEVTGALKKGKNQLEIRVTNEWTNRLMGDRLAPADKKVLSSYTNPFGGQYKLSESGLMGPVKLLFFSTEQKK